MAAVFYHNQEQKEAIDTSLTRLAADIKGDVQTKVLPYSGFTLAEDYHQKHALRRTKSIMEEFRRMYPNQQGLVDSTAAARVNGYLAGYGECDRLEAEIIDLGLSKDATRRLLRNVCGLKRAMSCPLGDETDNR